jgi:mannose-6-phosphate isomerase-like protein (cupin superfamily)
MALHLLISITRTREGFYVLEGELEFVVGTETVRVGRGGFVLVPEGVAHTFSNPTPTTARFLGTFTPAAVSELLRGTGPTASNNAVSASRTDC